VVDYSISFHKGKRLFKKLGAVPDILKAFRRYIQDKAEWDHEDLKWRKLAGAKFDEEE
jgi:hypothetical protein